MKMHRSKKQHVVYSDPAGAIWWWCAGCVSDEIPGCCGTSGVYHSLSRGGYGDPTALVETNRGIAFMTHYLMMGGK